MVDVVEIGGMVVDLVGYLYSSCIFNTNKIILTEFTLQYF